MQSTRWIHEALWVTKVKVLHWHWSKLPRVNIFKLLLPKNADFNISSALRWAIQDQWSSGFLFGTDTEGKKWNSDFQCNLLGALAFFLDWKPFSAGCFPVKMQRQRHWERNHSPLHPDDSELGLCWISKPFRRTWVRSTFEICCRGPIHYTSCRTSPQSLHCSQYRATNPSLSQHKPIRIGGRAIVETVNQCPDLLSPRCKIWTKLSVFLKCFKFSLKTLGWNPFTIGNCYFRMCWATATTLSSKSWLFWMSFLSLVLK